MNEEKEQGMYLVLVSVHGLIRSERLELGRDPDTGGQTAYVVELAKALIQHPDVEKVDLLTRMVVDPKVEKDYSKPFDEIEPGANIVRIQCGPRRYLRKEVLWPHLDGFVDNAMKYLRSISRMPDLIHAHYADAGYVGALMAGLLGVPLAYTGHSLGRVKRQRLMDQGMKIATIENRYHIGRRIEAEEMTLDNASIVVASTTQEVEEQYSAYDNYQPRRMTVIPPGIRLENFKPPPRITWDHPPIYRSIAKFLADPKKPMILALSRPDPRKNISTLIKAFGENEELRRMANLVIIAGSRDDINSMDRGAREVYYEILGLIDKYDLYGSVAYPKKHLREEVSDIYKIAAKTGGAFVNPALTEPFGLTLLEAAASGLPIIATEDGGPRDIISVCKNGVLIDPLATDKMGQVILDSLRDGRKLRQWSRNGVAGANRHYTWSGHVDKYIKTVKKVISQNERKRLWPRVKGRLVTNDRMLICDIDDTLTGDDEALSELLDTLERAGKLLGLGVATGRNLDLTLKVLKQKNIPVPNLLITSVGSEIHYGQKLMQDMGWARHINHRWKPAAIREIMKELPGLKEQPKEDQGPHKISYFVDPGKSPRPREISRILRRSGLYANLIYSHMAYLDIVPIRASKGLALRYFSVKWGIPIERFLVAGNSGNDMEMLSGNTLGVVVGNHSPELNSLKGSPKIYFAQGRHSWGILEAFDYYNFLEGTPAQKDG